MGCYQIVISGDNGREGLFFVLLVCDFYDSTKGEEMQPYCETKETFQSPSGNLERDIKVPSLSRRKDRAVSMENTSDSSRLSHRING